MEVPSTYLNIICSYLVFNADMYLCKYDMCNVNRIAIFKILVRSIASLCNTALKMHFLTLLSIYFLEFFKAIDPMIPSDTLSSFYSQYCLWGAMLWGMRLITHHCF